MKVTNHRRGVVRGTARAVAVAFLAVAFLAVASALTAGCDPREGSGAPDARPQVFTGRSTRQKDVIVLVELRTPAALVRFPRARRTGGGRGLARHLERIRAEQDAFLASLRRLSPEVRQVGRHAFVVNAVAVAVPVSLRDRVGGLPGASFVESAGAFARPAPVASAVSPTPGTFAALPASASMPPVLARAGVAAVVEAFKPEARAGRTLSFIGADAFHARGHTGTGVRIGVVDTGVDYTHAALGGPGTLAFSSSNAPGVVEPGSFPNAKVTGGIDLVGSAFDATSPDSEAHIPRPDPDPLDEGSHGTHVAAIAAGLAAPARGFGGGVAPGATLHAIKIFGREGGTDDAAILGALEHAADPDGDGDPRDAIDVLNLSFGSRYGTPSHLSSKAVRALARADVAVVASGGNDGLEPFVIGSPASAEDAIAVGASADDTPENWRFRAVEFRWEGDGGGLLLEAIEGETTLPLPGAPDEAPVPLIDLGAGDAAAFDTAVASGSLAGRVVLCDRGGISFDEKFRRAEAAGARGVVVVDSIDDDPFRMGGDGSFGIPGVMIGKTAGETLRAALAEGPVEADLTSARTFDKPELVDVLAAFSSRGPRAQDGLLKPDIVAPGVSVFSASAGSGDAFRYSSGTSMAAPHVAGAVALLLASGVAKDAGTAKAILMASAVPLREAGEEVGSLRLEAPTGQGAGRLALASPHGTHPRFDPPSVTLRADGESPRAPVEGAFRLLNPGTREVRVSLRVRGARGMRVELPAEVTLPAGGGRAVAYSAIPEEPSAHAATLPGVAPDPVASPPSAEGGARFAFIEAFDEANIRVAGFPMAFAPTGQDGARVRVARVVRAKGGGSHAPDPGAATRIELSNGGGADAHAFPYARWYADPRDGAVATPERDAARDAGHGACDLRGIALRILEPGLLQAAFVLRREVSTFALCEPSLLLDGDGDGVRDLEITAARASELAPSSFGLLGSVFSFLLDARKILETRARFDAGWTPAAGASPDYADAVVDLQDVFPYAPGRVIVLQADLAKAALAPAARFAAVLRNATEPVARPVDALGGAPVGRTPGEDDALPWHVFPAEALALPGTMGDVLVPAGARASLADGIVLPPGAVFLVPANGPSAIVLTSP